MVFPLSGDGDFDLLLKRINEKYGMKTRVNGVPALTAKPLIDSASLFYEIEEDLLKLKLAIINS
ncbi:NYN domain-containing protein [Corallincola luteus]|nr:NYN domain-containing protein [Corallincola luteus]